MSEMKSGHPTWMVFRVIFLFCPWNVEVDLLGRKIRCDVKVVCVLGDG